MSRSSALGEDQAPARIKDRPWKRERAACQRHLTRALRSPRYRRLIEDITAWIENGDWSRKRSEEGRRAARAAGGRILLRQIAGVANEALEEKPQAEEFGARKRHRVRLANKRLSYAIEAAEKLAPPSEAPARRPC